MSDPSSDQDRRLFLLRAAALGGTGLLATACAGRGGEGEGSSEAGGGKAAGGEKEVGAVEDLMREHGVLRRALIVYSESAPQLRRGPRTVPPDALRQTALLFRRFGEAYHEKMLEEPYIFPAVRPPGSGRRPDSSAAFRAGPPGSPRYRPRRAPPATPVSQRPWLDVHLRAACRLSEWAGARIFGHNALSTRRRWNNPYHGNRSQKNRQFLSTY